jgi:hypothetical protein
MGFSVFDGFNSATGTCDFLFLQSTSYETDPEFAQGATFNGAAMARLVYSTTENYINKTHIYFTPQFVGFFFGEILDTDRTRNFVCNVMGTKYPEFDAPYLYKDGNFEHKECVKRLEKLPILTEGRVDGFDQGCRALHAVFASTNDKHCAHLSFEPMEDPNGDIKCQVSSETSVADLFDVEVTFKNFIAVPESEVDPETGFSVLSTEQDLCDNARDAVEAACTLVQEECGGSKGGKCKSRNSKSKSSSKINSTRKSKNRRMHATTLECNPARKALDDAMQNKEEYCDLSD